MYSTFKTISQTVNLFPSFCFPVLIAFVEVAVGFAFTMGRVYSLTMLYNLNTRKRGRHTGHSGGTQTTSDARHPPISLSGIRASQFPFGTRDCLLTSAHICLEVSRSVHVNEDLTELGGVRSLFPLSRSANLSCRPSPRRGVEPLELNASIRKTTFTLRIRLRPLLLYKLRWILSPVFRFCITNARMSV